MGRYSKRCWCTKDNRQNSYGSNTNRKRLFNNKFFRVGGATHGYVIRFGYVKKTSGDYFYLKPAIFIYFFLNFYKCSIDLKANVLRIGTTGTETPFLSERDLPECARLSTTSEEDILSQSRKEAEEKDLQEAIKNSTTGSKCYGYYGFKFDTIMLTDVPKRGTKTKSTSSPYSSPRNNESSSSGTQTRSEKRWKPQ